MSDRTGISSPPTTISVFVLLAFVAIAPGFHRDLWNPDEPRIAHLARAMLDEGHWVVAHVNGDPFVEQPPLQAWLVAGAMKVFGTGPDRDWVPRVPSMLLSLALLALVYNAGARRWGRRVGLLSVVLLATTVEYFIGYQRSIVDTSLALLVTIAMLQLLELAAPLDPEKRDSALPLRRFALLGLASGLSFLSKNFIGIAFIGLVATGIALRDRRRFLTPRAALGALISVAVAALVAAPWLILFWRERPDLLHELLVRNTIGRFTSTDFHNPPLLSFLHRTLAALAPAIVLAAPFLWSCVMRLRAGERRPAEETLFCWILLPIALVLSSGSKREIYYLPVTPAVAMAAAVWLEPRLAARPVRIVASVLAITLLLALPLVGLIGGSWAGPLTTVFWICLGAHLGIGYAWLRRAGRFEGDAPAWALALLMLTGLAGGSMVTFQIKNHEESYLNLTRRIGEYVDSGHDVVAFRLPLRDISAIPYYLGRRVENLDSPEALAAKMARETPTLAVFRSSEMGTLEPALGPFREVGEFVVRRAIRVIVNRVRE